MNTLVSLYPACSSKYCSDVYSARVFIIDLDALRPIPDAPALSRRCSVRYMLSGVWRVGSIGKYGFARGFNAELEDWVESPKEVGADGTRGKLGMEGKTVVAANATWVAAAAGPAPRRRSTGWGTAAGMAGATWVSAACRRACGARLCQSAVEGPG